MKTDIGQSMEEHDDDAPVGRVLSRREVLTLLAGLGGTALLAACGPLGSSIAQSAATPSMPGNSAASGTAVATGTATSAGAAPTQGTADTTQVQATPSPDTAAVPDCVVRPEQTEGPYFKDEKINRSDIRSDTSTGVVKDGAPLALAFIVSQVGTGSCTPLKGAQIDVWHCDAAGTYSDTTDPNWGAPLGRTTCVDTK